MIRRNKKKKIILNCSSDRYLRIIGIVKNRSTRSKNRAMAEKHEEKRSQRRRRRKREPEESGKGEIVG